MMTDPIADMLTRIRNGQKARFEKVDIPASKVKSSIAQIMKDAGYINNYKVLKDSKQGVLQVYLKYGAKDEKIISSLQRVSKPSRRVYVDKDNIPVIRSGIGLAILSTSRGIITDTEARKQGVGGEVLCSIW